MSRHTAHRKIAARAAILALGASLALGAAGMAGPATAQQYAAQHAAQVVYALPHIEAVLSAALTSHVPVGRLQIEYDNRAIEVRAPADSGSLTVQNLYFNNLNGRFAAELVVPDDRRPIRAPVSGRAYGVVQAPILNRRVNPGDVITVSDVDWIEVRADQLGSDVAATDAQLVGMTPKRGVPLQSPVRLRDVQTPRVVAKGAIVTITYQTDRISLTAQGRSLEEGGVGDVIRVTNTQSNRIVQVTVAGPNLVAVAKPGGALN